METRQILTKYQPLRGNDYEQIECQESFQIDNSHRTEDAVWKHTNDLDVFFKNVYLYHKDGGFYCKLLNKILEIVQVIWMTFFTIVMLTAVDYAVMFRNKPPRGMDVYPMKLDIGDVIIPWNEAKENFNKWIILFLISSTFFILFKLGQTVASIPLYYKIKKFYDQGLQISANEVDTYTWDQVKRRIIKLQKEQQFCIQKEELNDLDIHHRILRFTNYFVGMVNHNVIDLNLEIPFRGKATYLSRGLKYNVDMALFWGPWSPFVNNWRLHDDFKRSDKLQENAEKIRKTFRLLAVVNFFLLIFILFWQVLYFFYSCAQFLKSEYLKLYKWSLFGEVYLRHFNELDHELELRLSKAFSPSITYVKTFNTKIFVMIISHLTSFLSVPFIIIAALTAWSPSVMIIVHCLTALTLLGIGIKYCYEVLPSESYVHDPEKYLRYVLHYTKYAPEHWLGKAHTPKVKEEFSKLFEHKVIHIIEDFLSPIITPYILGFKLPNNAMAIAEFLRKYTVEVEGVGDVCSFAHLKVYNCGEPQQTNFPESTWIDSNTIRSFNRAETSLLNFTINNRNWIPPQDSAMFISSLRERSLKQQEARSVLTRSEDRFFLPADNRASHISLSEQDEMAQNDALFESLRNYHRNSAQERLRGTAHFSAYSQSDDNIPLESNYNDQEPIFIPEVHHIN